MIRCIKPTIDRMTGVAEDREVAYAVRKETIDRFSEKLSRVKDRSIEPKNGGPTAYSFALAIGEVGFSRTVHGTVLNRLASKRG